MENKDIYDYIIAEEANYKTQKVPVQDGWEWNMYEHIRRSVLAKNSKFSKGENDGSRPYKNVIRPILNVSYRSEGFDVKDIEPFVDDEQFYYKSFLVRKYHPKWARKNDIDTFIDETVESYVDFGLALSKNVNTTKPENVPLQSIAFCDQTDILSGPICIRHQYSPDQLKDMEGKWWSGPIDMAITMAKSEKEMPGMGKETTKTPGKYIEVFELHGMFPETWLNKEEDAEIDEITGQKIYSTDPKKFCLQAHYVGFYKDTSNDKQGITFYKGKEKESIFKTIVRDKIHNRACGFGGIEELFEPQVWINYNEIKIKAMLDAAALMILQTADSAWETKNGNVNDLETGRVLYHEENKPLTQVTLQPQNQAVFENKTKEWEQNARTIGSAGDAQLGINPTSGTPFKLQDLVVDQGQGLHQYRQGKIATYLGEIYRDWVLVHLVKEMNNGQKFLDELSLDELQYVSESVIENEINSRIKEKMLKPGKEAKVMRQDAIDSLRSLLKEQFMKGGNKRFLEIVKGELKSLPIDVYMNIVGKQKNLSKNADKLTNIFRQIFANPQILAMPGMAKLFNEIIESSGFSPVDFSSFTKPAVAPVKSILPEKSMEELPLPAAV